MKKKILIIVSIVVGVVLLLGVGAAAGVGLLWGRMFFQGRMMGSVFPGTSQGSQSMRGRGMMQNEGGNALQPGWNNHSEMMNGNGMHSGKMGRNGTGLPWGNNTTTGDRITIDQALDKAKAALSSYGTNLKISEIMEFEDNFYVSVKESDTGRGAFELLVNPYNGNVGSEPGSNMMWNTKYGHMNFNNSNQQSEMTVDQAAEKASVYLKKALPAATLEKDGTAFYGYITFDYKVNGVVAGMLSVNSRSGDVWEHQWHGTFVSEKTVE
jgi:hypothetical protein